jgi:hypothetical protein
MAEIKVVRTVLLLFSFFLNAASDSFLRRDLRQMRNATTSEMLQALLLCKGAIVYFLPADT